MVSVDTSSDSTATTDPAEVFFAGTSRHELLVRRCLECGRLSWPVAQLGTTLNTCPHCYAPGLDWVRSSGRGKIYAFAIMHQIYDEALAPEIPYPLAVIELDEGIRTQHVRMVDCPNDALRIGLPVEVAFVEAGGLTVPKFRPA